MDAITQQSQQADASELVETWELLLTLLAKESPTAARLLRPAKPLYASNGILDIQFPYKFHFAELVKPERAQKIARAFMDVTGQWPDIWFRDEHGSAHRVDCALPVGQE